MGRSGSIFSQIVKFIPRGIFDDAVSEHKAGKHAKGMTSWCQFISLMFCHLEGARSLREIIGGLAASEGKLKHLGVDRAPSRSTLAYANAHRPWQMYRTLFGEAVELCRAEAKSRKRKFRFKHRLLPLDSTTITLCVSRFDWALYKTTKGAVKLHLVLDNGSVFATVRGHHRWQESGCDGGQDHEVLARGDAGVRPRLRGSWLVAAIDRREGVFRQPPQRKHRLYGGGDPA